MRLSDFFLSMCERYNLTWEEGLVVIYLSAWLHMAIVDILGAAILDFSPRIKQILQKFCKK